MNGNLQSISIDVNFCTFSSLFVSLVRSGLHTGAAYSRCGLINDVNLGEHFRVGPLVKLPVEHSDQLLCLSHNPFNLGCPRQIARKNYS